MMGEHAHPQRAEIAVEIDQYVDALRLDQLGGVMVRERLDRNETVERHVHPPAHRALVVAAIVEAHHFETLAVMLLEQARGQIHGGLGAKFTAEIADTKLAGPALSLGLIRPVSYTHLRAHETGRNIVCRL